MRNSKLGVIWRGAFAAAVLSVLLPCAVQAQSQTPPAATSSNAAIEASKARAAGAPNQAGVVTLVEGEARVASGAGAPRALKVGDTVNEGDLLSTSKGSEVHMVMQDSGFMALRASSQLMVVAYKADGGDDDKGVFRLLTGGLRSITGWIGHFNAKAYQLRTPTATVGIRGTDHETRVIPEGSSEGEPGTYDRVFAGETSLETEGGSAAVTPNQAGFVSEKPRAKPRLLADIPGFFRPGPHEAEINQKHAEIQKVIDQRRNERQKVILEKRQALGAAREQVKEDIVRNKAAMQDAARAAEADRLAANEQRSALQAETRDLKERWAKHKETREELQAVVKTGQITMPDLRKRRKALGDEAKELEQTQADLERRWREFQDEQDSKFAERLKAGIERSQNLYNDHTGAHDKRKDLEAERDSAKQELSTMQRQENQRFQSERQADRKLNAASSPASAPN